MVSESSLDAVASTLWLVRHGESTWNVLGLAQGHRDDARLTERGVRQAKAVAAGFAGRRVRALYASDLLRARQSAACIADVLRLEVSLDARLRERCLGVLEGGPFPDVTPELSGLSCGRVADPDASPEGGESVRDLYLRAAAFADDLARKPAPGDVAVVAHGGTLRVLNAYLHGIPVEDMGWEPLENARVLRVAFGKRGPH